MKFASILAVLAVMLFALVIAGEPRSCSACGQVLPAMSSSGSAGHTLVVLMNFSRC